MYTKYFFHFSCFKALGLPKQTSAKPISELKPHFINRALLVCRLIHEILYR